MKLITIVHELRKASGTNAKLEILKKHKDNTLWKKFLEYTYHPYKAYHVSTPKTFDFDAEVITEEMFTALDKLSNREITGNKAKMLAKDLSTLYGEIPRLILGRSIKAGISVITINKAYPGLIYTFETMKGKDVPFEEWPVYTSIKYDGVKVFVEVREEDITIRTSSGMPFKLDSLEREFSTACFGVYEGELIYKEGRMKDRPVITGKLNQLLSGTVTDISNYSYMVYDFNTLHEWDSKTPKQTWIDRQENLNNAFEYCVKDSARCRRVVHYFHRNEHEWSEMYEHLVSNGYEGTISRYPHDEYAYKRVDRLIKKKAIRECILKCNGYTPHSNPSKGQIGSLHLVGNITDKNAGEVFVEVSTGSGLSKFDINSEPERFIGKKIEVIYNSVTKTETGCSLFLPRFKRIVGHDD